MYAILKGVPWNERDKEADETLELLQLKDKGDELSKNLSGGMKRKLCLGIAIIGGSNILYLDEPTSGMDVEARRGVWDTLKQIRHGRTMVLTTHYMEEADFLGDRIAIMAEGEIHCCGSPMFLKNRLGTGYHLHVVKSDDFNKTKFDSFLEKHIPDSTIESENETEVSVKLSSSSESDFGTMFKEMEGQKSKLGIESYGVTITTLEDVFIKINELAVTKQQITEDPTTIAANAETKDTFVTSHRKDPLIGRLIQHQIYALLLKRIYYTKRRWICFILQIIIPFAAMFYFLHSANAMVAESTISPMKIDIQSMYGDTEGFYNARKPDVENIAESIKAVMKANKVEAKNVSDPTPYILKYAKDDNSKYLTKLLIGGVVDKSSGNTINLTAWYNGEQLHPVTMSLLIMHNAFLKTIDSSGTITLTNAPVKPEKRKDSIESRANLFSNVNVAIFPLFLVFMHISSFLQLTDERISKAKLLQLMCGVKIVIYWAAMFIWDYAICISLAVLLLIPFAVMKTDEFFFPPYEALGSVIILILLFGWASIPLSYLISFIFRRGSQGLTIYFLIAGLFGMAAFFLYMFLDMHGEENLKGAAIASWVLRIVPQFSITFGFLNLFKIASDNTLCRSISKEELNATCHATVIEKWDPYFGCCPDICKKVNLCFKEASPFTMQFKGCGRDMAFLALDGVIFFAILLLIESPVTRRCFDWIIRKLSRNRPQKQFGKLDDDVIREQERILHQFSVKADTGKDALVSMNLTKVFSDFYAVNHLTFGIHQDECFGLLGVNGAGKTTTFRMLTGDCIPTEGDAYIQKCSLASNQQKFQSYLGYCPQFDPIIDCLTGREQLTFFARLRGITGPKVEEQVNAMIRLTDLTKHADKKSGFYSGGNKRKLSVGMALIGFPPLLLLDEPTAGVDPISRRKIWNALLKARTVANSSIILTSHSMEETEALCSRLAIMVNGQFCCLGSIQHLKSKFGHGYTLIIKLNVETQDDPNVLQAAKDYVREGLGGPELKDVHQGMLQYHITDTSFQLSDLFKFMSQMKTIFNLEDYLISQTTLEQIFITFARKQRETE